jgi:hypothetical protein
VALCAAAGSMHEQMNAAVRTASTTRFAIDQSPRTQAMIAYFVSVGELLAV